VPLSWHSVAVTQPPQSPGQVARVSPQSHLALPQELPIVPLVQIWPELGDVQLPFITQVAPEAQSPAAQPQSVAQVEASSPQSQVPLPQEATSCVPMQMVPVGPQEPSVIQVPGAVWQPLLQAQSAAHEAEVSPQSQAPSPQLSMSDPFEHT
jgi:hypothetical protein